MAQENSPVLYILYNAKASVMGKLDYTYRHFCAPKDTSACSACDLTHGGLRLSESNEWKATKAQIDCRIEQLHRDEMSPELREFVKSTEIEYPVVLGGSGGIETLKVLLNSADLLRVSQDHSAFLTLLKERSQQQGLPIQISSK